MRLREANRRWDWQTSQFERLRFTCASIMRVFGTIGERIVFTNPRLVRRAIAAFALCVLLQSLHFILQDQHSFWSRYVHWGLQNGYAEPVYWATRFARDVLWLTGILMLIVASPRHSVSSSHRWVRRLLLTFGPLAVVVGVGDFLFESLNLSLGTFGHLWYQRTSVCTTACFMASSACLFLMLVAVLQQTRQRTLEHASVIAWLLWMLFALKIESLWWEFRIYAIDELRDEYATAGRVVPFVPPYQWVLQSIDVWQARALLLLIGGIVFLYLVHRGLRSVAWCAKCPRCDYDLRGGQHVATGCPECGWGRAR